ncbi:MAG: hypothetical protein ABTQ29_12885 [Siculibacillus sp.]
MTILSLLLGLAAGALLFGAGWLAGVSRGNDARERLRNLTFLQGREMQQMREEFGRKSTAQERMLRSTIEQALAPLVQREQLSLDLSQLKTDSGQRRDLTLLLDKIAEVGNFSSVVLSDEEGLPLAANAKAQGIDRQAANSSMILLLADRMSGADRPAPQSILVHDVSNTTTLCRIFAVNDQRLSLSAVTSGARLTPTALDPVLVKVVGMLSSNG